MGASPLLRAAIDEARAGNRKKSRLILQQLLQDEPRHEVAWLWLSKVSATRDDKIAALEMALSLNPSRAETAVYLQKLKQQSLVSTTDSPDDNSLDDLYRQASTAYQDGRSLKARMLLQQIVEENQNYAKAWFALGRIEPKLEDQLFALTVGLHLKPENSKVQTRLAALEANGLLNHFDLAQRFESFGMVDTAVIYYQKAAQLAVQDETRWAAQEKQQQLQLQQKVQEVLVTTNSTLNLVRLTTGPIILYLLLILIVSGLNPLHITLPSLIGALIVTIGSFFIVSANQHPAHPIWQPLLGSKGKKSTPQQFLLTGIGIALLLLPFAAIFLTNANEFMTYYAIQPINFSH